MQSDPSAPCLSCPAFTVWLVGGPMQDRADSVSHDKHRVTEQQSVTYRAVATHGERFT